MEFIYVGDYLCLGNEGGRLREKNRRDNSTGKRQQILFKIPPIYLGFFCLVV